MRAGELKHAIDIQQLTGQADQYNDVVQAWQNYHSTHAAIKPVSGREFVEQHAQHGEIEYQVKLRYYPGITEKMRVLWGAIALEIIVVLDLNGAHVELQLMCRVIT